MLFGFRVYFCFNLSFLVQSCLFLLKIVKSRFFTLNLVVTCLFLFATCLVWDLYKIVFVPYSYSKVVISYVNCDRICPYSQKCLDACLALISDLALLSDNAICPLQLLQQIHCVIGQESHLTFWLLALPSNCPILTSTLAPMMSCTVYCIKVFSYQNIKGRCVTTPQNLSFLEDLPAMRLYTKMNQAERRLNINGEMKVSRAAAY